MKYLLMAASAAFFLPVNGVTVAANTVELTILMPCLNEALTLGRCIEKARAFLARSGVIGEVVIADNGSTDGSQDLARSLGARVISVPDPDKVVAALDGPKSNTSISRGAVSLGQM